MSEDTDVFDPLMFNVSWERLQDGCVDMCNNIANVTTERPKVVITKEEDAIVGAMVANILDIPFAVAHTNPTKNNGIILKCAPVVSAPIRSGEYHQTHHPILMVSSLIDDGRNIDDLVTAYTMYGHPVTTMSILYKRGLHEPDYYTTLVNANAYCQFPWK